MQKNKNALSDAKIERNGKSLVRDFKLGIEFPTTKVTKEVQNLLLTQKVIPLKSYKFGGKVVQKMQSGGEKLSQKEIEEAIRQIGEQGNVFGKGESLSPSQTKKIADKFESDFTKMFGKKYGGAIRKMRGGGLMEAIKKVQAKGMKLGGEAKPLVGGQKKLDKNKDGRISGDDFAMMEMGGKVEEYGGGGKVKGGKMSCRGMGKALRGGGFKIS